MGFFDKKAVCGVCGKEIGLNRYKVKESDAWICPECLKAAGGPFQVNLSKITIEELKDRIARRPQELKEKEENRQAVEKERQQKHEALQEEKQQKSEALQEEKRQRLDSLQTAEGMYEYCAKNGFGSGFTKGWGIKHFKVVEDNLMPNEKVYMAFMGLHNYESTKQHDGNFAYVITDKRIIMAQKEAIGQKFQTVSKENINDITFSSGLLFGVLTIDTYKETFNVGLDKNSAKNINTELHRVLEQIKAESKLNIPATPQVESSADEIKKFADLYAQGILTDEEFAAKKKQLLGI